MTDEGEEAKGRRFGYVQVASAQAIRAARLDVEDVYRDRADAALQKAVEAAGFLYNGDRMRFARYPMKIVDDAMAPCELHDPDMVYVEYRATYIARPDDSLRRLLEALKYGGSVPATDEEIGEEVERRQRCGCPICRPAP